MTCEGKQQLSVPCGSAGARGLDGEGGLPHQRNTKKTSNQTKKPNNKNNKKRRQESTDGNFSRRPKPATAATHTEAVAWLEKGRGCMGQGGKGEGEGELGIINHCQLNFISQENKKTICRHTDENKEMRFSQDEFVKNILHQIKLISLCGKVIGFVDILEVSKTSDSLPNIFLSKLGKDALTQTPSTRLKIKLETV